jgi:pimeloyl-ACP methyl ester carboxylesterase
MPAVEGVRHAFHRVNGVRLHLAEAGQGRPLLLLHGFPQHWYMWRRFILALSDEYRMLCPDLRGYGWSEAPRDGYDKETMARDVIALLDELEVGEYAIAAHDWGAWVGTLMALFEPDRVQQLVIMNMMLPFSRATPRYWANFWHLWHGQLLGLPRLGIRAVQGRPPFNDVVFNWLDANRWAPEERRIFLWQFQEWSRARAAYRMYQAVRRRDAPQMFFGRYRRMAPVRAQTLLLYGRQDKTVQPIHFAGCARYFDDIAVECVDCGHSLVEEKPEFIVERTREFLT